jgi:hypothetical protein
MAMYDPVDMKSNTRARTLAIASPLRGMPSALSMIFRQIIVPPDTGGVARLTISEIKPAIANQVGPTGA